MNAITRPTSPSAAENVFKIEMALFNCSSLLRKLSIPACKLSESSLSLSAISYSWAFDSRSICCEISFRNETKRSRVA